VALKAVAAREVLLANHQHANSYVLETQEVRSRAERFVCTWQLPAEVPWSHLIVRATADRGAESAFGVLSPPVKAIGTPR
jgi:hypothetical protein